MVDSTSWSTQFNAKGGRGYDNKTFQMENTPFYNCGLQYYSKNAEQRPTSFTNPKPKPGTSPPPMSFSTRVIDPTNSDTAGDVNADVTNYKNGFTTAYWLGFAYGASNPLTYVYISETAFNLIDKTDGAKTKDNGEQNLVASMMNIKDVYLNRGFTFSSESVITNVNFQRGFYGVFNGYFQGVIDAVNAKTNGDPKFKDLSDLMALRDYYCKQAELCKSRGEDKDPKTSSNTQQLYDTCEYDISMCKYLSGVVDKNSPPNDITDDLAGIVKNTRKTGKDGIDTTDYAAAYLDALFKLYKAVKTQNDTTLKTIQSNIDVFSSDDQKIFYQTQQILSTSYLNIALLVIYYLLFPIVVYMIFYVDTKMDKRGRYLLALFFLTYPFVINPICIYLYYAFMYFYAVSNTNVYSPGTY